MPKYLIEASYTAEGTKGVTQEGGTARRAVVQKMVESLGGRLETFYFGFGDNDVYAIFELPDELTAAAISLAVTSTGAARTKTIVLLSPEEIDEAVRKRIAYKPPGAGRRRSSRK
jgi:uncharacterized protein with GYD domain